MRTFKRSFLATAVAALLLGATSIQAAVVNLYIDPAQSTLTQGGTISAPSIPLTLPSVSQGAGGLGATTNYQGTINIDVTPTTLQLLPGSAIDANVSGTWKPAGTNGVGDPTTGTSAPADYGMKNAFGSSLSAYYGLVLDFGAPDYGISSTPMLLAGNNFDLAGQAMQFIAGRLAFIAPGVGEADDSDVIGFPTLFGTSSADIGSWDGTTLIIPVHATLSYVIGQVAPYGDIVQTISWTGQIVATTTQPVPEPSTMILAGLGVVGLVATGYRSRKRKA